MDKSKRLRRFETFDREEKINLIRTIESWPVLWDKSHKRHFDQLAVRGAWKSVASEMQKQVTACRGAWNSLRDSLRYHRGKAAKSGSANGVPLEEQNLEDTDINWEFAPFMSFLPHTSSEKRKAPSTEFIKIDGHSAAECSSPLNSPLEDEETTMMFRESEDDRLADFDDSAASRSNLYINGKSAKKPKVEDTSTNELIGLIENYFTEAPKAQRAIFPFWNELLNKMPPEVATDVEVDMTVMLHKKLKALKK